MASDNDPKKPSESVPAQASAPAQASDALPALPDVPIISVERPPPALRDPPRDPDEITPPRPLSLETGAAQPRAAPLPRRRARWLGVVLVGAAVLVGLALAVRFGRAQPSASTVTIREDEVRLVRSDAGAETPPP